MPARARTHTHTHTHTKRHIWPRSPSSSSSVIAIGPSFGLINRLKWSWSEFAKRLLLTIEYIVMHIPPPKLQPGQFEWRVGSWGGGGRRGGGLHDSSQWKKSCSLSLSLSLSHTHTHTHVRTHTHARTHTRTRAHARTHARTRTHAHTESPYQTEISGSV